LDALADGAKVVDDEMPDWLKDGFDAGGWNTIFKIFNNGVDSFGRFNDAVVEVDGSMVDFEEAARSAYLETVSGTANAAAGVEALGGEVGDTEDEVVSLRDATRAAFSETIPAAIDISDRKLQEWKDHLNSDAEFDKMSTEVFEWAGDVTASSADAEGAVIDYIGTLDDVPAATITDLQTAFDSKNLDDLTRLLAGLPKQPVYIDIITRRTTLPGASIGFPQGVPQTRTTNVHVNLAAQPSSRELSRMVTEWERNG
jgi:hypothetical protein